MDRLVFLVMTPGKAGKIIRGPCWPNQSEQLAALAPEWSGLAPDGGGRTPEVLPLLLTPAPGQGSREHPWWLSSDCFLSQIPETSGRGQTKLGEGFTGGPQCPVPLLAVSLGQGAQPLPASVSSL